jgi:amino acid adenylation domain-containing protein
VRGDWGRLGKAPDEVETLTLTPIQKGLLAETLVASEPGLNIEQVVWELDFVPDPVRFRAAWQHAIDVFDALRLSFLWPSSNKEPAQTVQAQVRLPFRELDWSAAESTVAQARLEHFLEQDRQDGFDVLSVPLTRVSLLTLGGTKAVCVWTVHQSIVDGASCALVLERVFARYQAGEAARTEAPPSFREFLRWSESRDTTAGAKHFANALQGFVEATPLPLQQIGAPTAQAKTKAKAKALRAHLQLEPQATEKLRSAARETGTSLSAFVQLAWALLLSNYTGHTDIVFGTTSSARQGTIDRAEQVVGPLGNVVPLRAKVADAATVRELVLALHQQQLALDPFTHTGLLEIKAASGLAVAPHLFQTLVVFEDQSLQAELLAMDARWKNQRVWSRWQTGYPVVLAAGLEGASLELTLELDVGLYDDDMASRLLADYARLLRGVAEQLEQAPRAVPMLEPQLLQTLTAREAERELLPLQPLAISRILEQARKSPTHTAVEQLDGRAISYAELERRVLQLASVLRKRGVGPGVLVAVRLPRSIDSVVALLAVHAAGGAFLPLDPANPEQRVDNILEDSKAALLLVAGATRGRARAIPISELDVDLLSAEEGGLREAQSPTPDSVAYVIYTSGSTGLPKGVRVSQAALANHLAAILELFALTPADRVLQFTTPTFDVALEEILPTLAAGATLVLRDEATAQSARGFFEAVARANISLVNLPTAFWHQLAHVQDAVWPTCLRLVVVGGERASPQSHRKFRQAGTGHLRFLNAYGPTEATITSTYYDDSEGDHGPDGLPIGRPLPGVSHFVLDEDLRPVPPGSVGQLYIGGAGLALGYLFREQLTQERFISHPWRAGARLYATGDLVRQTAAGNYVYIDRPDYQIKLRGFRVELGEIEAQLQRHPAVSEAVVILSKRAASESLVAFVIADEEAVTDAGLREHLAVALPAQMLPARFVISSSLPATLSGKVDRRALAELDLDPQESTPRTRASDRPPVIDHTVETLLEIWSEVLGTPVTSTSASFFDLGGHSLLVVRMFSEIEQRLSKTCNVAAFFKNPTIAHLAELLRDAKGRQRSSSMQLAAGSNKVRPLFFAPGVTGRAVDFVHLVDALSDDVPVYALQLRAFGGNERPDETLEEALREVVDLMQQVQPRGPYAIAGFSAGGVFAVAIAEELRARGEATDFVGLIDCVPPASVPTPSPLTSPRRLLRLSKTIAGRVEEILAETNSVQSLLQRSRDALRRNVGRWDGLWFKYQPTVEELFGALPNFSMREVETMQRYLDAIDGHRFDTLTLDLVLFRIPLDPPEGPYEEDLGWGRVTSGKVTVEQVAGKHNDLMTSAGCRELAARFDAYLKQRV